VRVGVGEIGAERDVEQPLDRLKAASVRRGDGLAALQLEQ
jgi:hypothetical protein